jgi:D-3-phosphoglycerate dehydrogenase
LTADILENAKNLKVIGRAGVGLDNVDLEKAGQMKIKVFNTPEAPSVSVAELAISLMLSLARHITKADKTMHEGEWLKNDYMGYVLKGKKVGLIGFGNIGQAVAKRCAALEMEVGVFDVISELLEKAKTLGYAVYPSIDELVAKAQIISLHIPANEQTKNMINEKRLKLMNKSTVIINTARGALIDEAALIKSLKNGEIGGAALDVFREEPLKNEDLYNIGENLILTPHIGSSTVETQVSAAVGVAEKISQYLKEL